jgi:hypothetical protein
MAPSVFVCNSIVRLVRSGGAGEYVPLAYDIDTLGTASKALKFAAPLCTGAWNIYVERVGDGQRCNFGVFCGSSDPSSLTVDEVTLSEFDEKFPVVKISQSVTNKVEVRTSKGDAIEFRFNDEVDDNELDGHLAIGKLALAAVSAVLDENPTFIGFMERVLATAIRDSHGTLIAVVAGDSVVVPDSLTDAVLLTEPIDLLGRYRLHEEEEKTAISVGRLQAAAELLRGFVNSDGITVLNAAGKVLAYRAFIRSAEPASPAAGGARTRAFAALSGLVGSGLDAALFRSQDGRIDITIAKKAGQNG